MRSRRLRLFWAFCEGATDGRPYGGGFCKSRVVGRGAFATAYEQSSMPTTLKRRSPHPAVIGGWRAARFAHTIVYVGTSGICERMFFLKKEPKTLRGGISISPPLRNHPLETTKGGRCPLVDTPCLNPSVTLRVTAPLLGEPHGKATNAVVRGALRVGECRSKGRLAGG